jgi:peptidoglycan/xylan/chitin deacetylase (PgdA/CDA1 family)
MRGRTWIAAAGLVLAACGGGHHPLKPTPSASAPKRTPAARTDAAAVAARSHVPVLCYHQIRDQTAADSATDRQYIVGPGAFAAQMQALDKAGYTPVNGYALVAHAATGYKLPRKPILITLDDGSEGPWTRALPVLEQHRFKATFFPMTVVLGQPGWLTKRQVRALDETGMTIGAHTWDHHAVTGYKGDDWRIQLEQPKAELEKLLGHPVTIFAYPYGLWDSGAFSHIKAAGYHAAFQLSGKLDRAAPLMTLRRIIVPQWTGAQLLHAIKEDF